MFPLVEFVIIIAKKNHTQLNVSSICIYDEQLQTA